MLVPVHGTREIGFLAPVKITLAAVVYEAPWATHERL